MDGFQVVQKPYLTDRSRISLMGRILKAHPEALSEIDKETGLPPFALPIRRALSARCEEDSSSDEERFVCISSWNDYTSLSSAYFLLRQKLEMLSEVVKDASSKNVSTEPASKRSRTS